jgi:hypothetical protein
MKPFLGLYFSVKKFFYFGGNTALDLLALMGQEGQVHDYY